MLRPVQLAGLLPAASPAAKGWHCWFQVVKEAKAETLRWVPRLTDVWHSVLYSWAAEVGEKFMQETITFLSRCFLGQILANGCWAREFSHCFWSLQSLGTLAGVSCSTCAMSPADIETEKMCWTRGGEKVLLQPLASSSSNACKVRQDCPSFLLHYMFLKPTTYCNSEWSYSSFVGED